MDATSNKSGVNAPPASTGGGGAQQPPPQASDNQSQKSQNLLQDRFKLHDAKIQQVKLREITTLLRELKKKVSENDKSQFHLSKMSGVVRDLVSAMQITIVDAKDLYKYETDQKASVKQSDAIIDGIVMNLEVRTKKKHDNKDQILLTVEEVLESLKEFLKEMSSQFSVLDRPPNNTPAPSEQKPPAGQPSAGMVSPNGSVAGSILNAAQQQKSMQPPQSGPNDLLKIPSQQVSVKSADEAKKQQEATASPSKQAESVKTAGAKSDKFADKIVDKDGNLKKPVLDAWFRSINQHFEWNEDDEGHRVDVPVPLDDVVEGLKRKDFNAAVGDQKVAALSPRLKNPLDPSNMDGTKTFKEMIQKTIGEYQSILDTKQYKDGDDRKRVETTVKELRKQLAQLKQQLLKQTTAQSVSLETQSTRSQGLSVRSSLQKNDPRLRNKVGKNYATAADPRLELSIIEQSELPYDEMVIQNLQEIFIIYCRSHMLSNKHQTFEEIKREARNMNLGEFIKFTKDFSIDLPKTVISSVFKRTALYSREMYFNNLKDALIQLMKEANKQKLDKFKQELKDVKLALVSAIASPDADKTAEEQLKERYKKIQAEEQKVKIANEDEESLYKEILHNYIFIDDPQKYRSKIKNFDQIYAAGLLEMKERQLGLVKESEIIPKPQLQQQKEGADAYSFKPTLYKNPYKGRVQSVIKGHIDDHNKNIQQLQKRRVDFLYQESQQEVNAPSQDGRSQKYEEESLMGVQQQQSPNTVIAPRAVPENRRKRMMEQLNNRIIKEQEKKVPLHKYKDKKGVAGANNQDSQISLNGQGGQNIMSQSMIYEDDNISPRVVHGNQNPNHSQMYINEEETISMGDNQSLKRANDKYDPIEVQQTLGMQKINLRDLKQAPPHKRVGLNLQTLATTDNENLFFKDPHAKNQSILAELIDFNEMPLKSSKTRVSKSKNIQSMQPPMTQLQKQAGNHSIITQNGGGGVIKQARTDQLSSQRLILQNPLIQQQQPHSSLNLSYVQEYPVKNHQPKTHKVYQQPHSSLAANNNQQQVIKLPSLKPNGKQAVSPHPYNSNPTRHTQGAQYNLQQPQQKSQLPRQVNTKQMNYSQIEDIRNNISQNIRAGSLLKKNLIKGQQQQHPQNLLLAQKVTRSVERLK